MTPGRGDRTVEDGFALRPGPPAVKRTGKGDGIVTDRMIRSGFEVGEHRRARQRQAGLAPPGAQGGGRDRRALRPSGRWRRPAAADDTSTDASPSAAAGTPNKGGDLMVGIVGGSAKDTADPHTGSFEPDIAIQYIMYEGLTAWDFDMKVTNQLAETIEPNADGSVWQVKLRDGVTVARRQARHRRRRRVLHGPHRRPEGPEGRLPPRSPASRSGRHQEDRRQDGRDHARRRRTCCSTRASPSAAARSCRWASTPRTPSAAVRSR